MNKKILLIGGRSKAKALATSLLQSGYEVTAINASAQDCQKLAEISGLKVLAGDGTKPYILEDANAGAFANISNDDGKEKKSDEEDLEVEESGGDGDSSGGENAVSERHHRGGKLV